MTRTVGQLVTWCDNRQSLHLFKQQLKIGLMLKRTPQDQLEDESINAVSSFFNENGWEFNRQTRDKSGIDAEIEIIHGVERTGRYLKSQIKAGNSYISSETENILKIRVERKYLEHWQKMSAPVVLFFYYPDTRQIFWKAVKEHIELNPSILNGATETWVIPFDKERERLDAESLASLEAVEAKQFSYENILVESGHSELGWSNLFLVRRFPPLWSADVGLRSTSRIAAHLNRQYTFVFQDNQLLTFSDIRSDDCELRNFVDTGSIRSIPEDSVSGPTIVELLNQALLFLAQANDLIRRGDRFYFSPSLLKTPEKNIFSYIALKGEPTERTKIYMQKSEYKHHAVRLAFLQHCRNWYLQLDPDWYFTFPYGKRPTKAALGARITSEKASMHNKDYLYLLHFWRQFLSGGKSAIDIPCSMPSDGASVEVSALPLELKFSFRLFNDYIGPKS
jgi:hypothetical protein